MNETVAIAVPRGRYYLKRAPSGNEKKTPGRRKPNSTDGSQSKIKNNKRAISSVAVFGPLDSTCFEVCQSLLVRSFHIFQNQTVSGPFKEDQTSLVCVFI